jgi:hypothetical protein
VSKVNWSETLFCSAGECLERAIGFGRMTVQVDALCEAAPHEKHLDFALPLCGLHAHALGLGVSLVSVRTGLEDVEG